MANFKTTASFAINNTSKRSPNNSEQFQGFDCGAADRDLFNGMFYRIEAELGEVIRWGGITPTDSRHSIIREALEEFQDKKINYELLDTTLVSKTATFEEFKTQILIDVSTLPIGDKHNYLDIVALTQCSLDGLLGFTTTTSIKDLNDGGVWLGSVEIVQNSASPIIQRDTQSTKARIINGKVLLSLEASRSGGTTIPITGGKIDFTSLIWVKGSSYRRV